MTFTVPVTSVGSPTPLPPVLSPPAPPPVVGGLLPTPQPGIEHAGPACGSLRSSTHPSSAAAIIGTSSQHPPEAMFLLSRAAAQGTRNALAEAHSAASERSALVVSGV